MGLKDGRPPSGLGPRLAGGALLLLMLVALLARLHGLAELSITLEEYACIYHLDAPDFLTFIERQRAHYPYGAPLVPMLQYGWARAAGGDAAALRLLSLGASLLTLPLLYLLTRRFFQDPARGRMAGIVAVLCAALSHHHVYHGQEARMYAFLGLFAIASVYALTRVLEGGSRRWWWLWTAANTLVAWTHLFGILLLAVEGVIVLARHARQGRLLLTWGAAHAVPLLPLLLWIRAIPEQPGRLMEYYAPPGFSVLLWDYFGDDIVRRASLGFAGRPEDLAAAPWYVQSPLPLEYAIAAVFVVAACWLGWRCVAARGARASWVLLLLWFIVPVALLAVVSHLWTPVYSSRYSMHGIYPLYIGLGGLAAMLPRRWLQGVALLLIAAVYTQQLLVAWSRPVRTQWRPVVERIAAEGGPHDIVLVEDFFWLPLLEMNSRGLLSLPMAAAFERETLCPLSCTIAAIPHEDGARRVWVVLVDVGDRDNSGLHACLDGCAEAFTWEHYPGERPLELLMVRAPAEPPDPEAARWEGFEKADAVHGLLDVVYTYPDDFGGAHLRIGLLALLHGDAALAAPMLAEAVAINPHYAVHLTVLRYLSGHPPEDQALAGAICALHDRHFDALARFIPDLPMDSALQEWLAWNAYQHLPSEEEAGYYRRMLDARDLPPPWQQFYSPFDEWPAR